MNLPIEQIEKQLKKVLLECTTQPVKAEDIHSDIALLGQGLALDSVALLEFIVGAEDEFNILLDDSALTVEHFKTFNTIARYIQTQVAEQETS